MRGKVVASVVLVAVSGITPAYAGKRHKMNYSDLYMLGSPPPMRGKDFGRFVKHFLLRITPAYAGKSLDTKKM